MKIECICSRTFLLKLKQKLIAWFKCKKFEHFQRISEMTLNHSMHWKIYIKVLSVCTVQCAMIEFGVISCNFFGIWSMMRKLHGTSSQKNSISLYWCNNFINHNCRNSTSISFYSAATSIILLRIIAECMNIYVKLSRQFFFLNRYSVDVFL